MSGEPRRDDASWAKPLPRFAPDVGRNVGGRRLSGPAQGFGQLWQKTYQLRLPGSAATPQEVVADLKMNLPAYQPKNNRFFPSVAGVAPGEVVIISASVSGMPVDTGVLVMYADDEAFTLMCPEGHPESGWNTFSAFSDDGVTVVQIQSMSRANDPIFEFGFRFMGGSRAQEKIWQHVLARVAEHYGVPADVKTAKVKVDPRMQWSFVGNVWQNSIIRTTLWKVTAPARWAAKPLRRQ